MSDLQITGDRSPFDAIRRVRPDGSEYWTARDLMPLLGYDRWENFERPVREARKAADITGSQDQFRDSTKKVETGSGARREIFDVEMTRYGAYMVAMSCDGRKPEVAEAKTYFAIRTREAEMRPVVPQSREERLALAVIDAQEMIAERDEQLSIAKTENRTLVAAIERDAPLVAKAEAHTGSDSTVHRQEFAREVITWGMRQKNIVIKQADVLRFLGHISLFIRGERTDTGHATSEAMKRGLAFTDKGTAKNGHAWATGKLTARGQDYAWKRITKYVDEHGTLELPRELRGDDPA